MQSTKVEFPFTHLPAHTPTMMLRSTLTALLLAAPYVHATALTSMLGANEKSCYYADVDGVGEKVGTYCPSARRPS
jgi:hypothetical protein